MKKAMTIGTMIEAVTFITASRRMAARKTRISLMIFIVLSDSAGVMVGIIPRYGKNTQFGIQSAPWKEMDIFSGYA